LERGMGRGGRRKKRNVKEKRGGLKNTADREKRDRRQVTVKFDLKGGDL